MEARQEVCQAGRLLKRSCVGSAGKYCRFSGLGVSTNMGPFAADPFKGHMFVSVI